MLYVNVSSNVASAKALVDAMTSKNFNFAVTRALTWAAQDAQKAVKDSLPGHFKIRRTWVPQGIRVKAATPTDRVARVWSKDEFMSRQEDGEDKTPKRDRNLAIPLATVRRNKSDIITKAKYPAKIPNTLQGKGGKLSAVLTTKAGEQYLVKLNPKRKRSAGNRFTFLYSLRPRAKIKPRLGLVKTTLESVRATFGVRLEESIASVIANPKR